MRSGQDGENALAIQATSNVDRGAFSRRLIDDREHEELTPVPGAVLNEVKSTDVAWALGLKPYVGPIVEPEPPPFRLFLLNKWVLSPPDPNNTLGIRASAVAPEQCGDLSIAGATKLTGKLDDRSRQRALVIMTLRLSPQGRSMLPHHLAGSALYHA